MAYTWSNVTLTIKEGATAGTDFSCPCTRAEFVPTVNNLRQATLCGPVATVGDISYDFQLEGLQDFDDAAGLANFLLTNLRAKVVVTVEITPPGAANVVTTTADATIVPPQIGGVADAWAQFACTLPVDGIPVVTLVPVP
jgi:hypothetical protein